MLVLAIFTVISGHAQESGQEHPLSTKAEQSLREKVRLRQYPGGRDEENLKVQLQLPQFQQKEEIVEEESEYGQSE